VPVSITRQAVDGVARSSWEVIDEHLLNPTGDWALLRTMLIDAIGEQLATEDNPVSHIERKLLAGVYASGVLKVSFVDTLAVVRRAVPRCPAAMQHPAGHVLCGDDAFTITWDTFRQLVAKAHRSAPTSQQNPQPLRMRLTLGPVDVTEAPDVR
jgi:hypothetical protein